MRFFGSILLFKNCHFAQFLANLGSEPKFEGGKKLVITRGWLKMRSLCPNSATLRWHTNRILHIDPKCGIWKVRFFGSILLFKNCHFAQFLANVAQNRNLKGKEACNHTWMVENEKSMPKFCNTKMAHIPYTAYRPQIWNLEGVSFCSVLLFKNVSILINFWQILAHNRNLKGERSL